MSALSFGTLSLVIVAGNGLALGEGGDFHHSDS